MLLFLYIVISTLIKNFTFLIPHFLLIVSTRSKSLTSTYSADDTTTLRQQETDEQKLQQPRKNSRSSRSPFSIRKVRAVKPEKITMNDNNNSLSAEGSKKRSSFLRRKLSHGKEIKSCYINSQNKQ